MKYYIANWKMNMNAEEIQKWTNTFLELTLKQSNENMQKEIIIAPSLPYLSQVKEAGFITTAQNISAYERGAYTGETGAFQIKDYCKYCIVGHSERKESREEVLKKRDECLKEGIIPIVCFVTLEDAVAYYKPGVILAWEDPQNISVNGQYRPRDPQDIRTNINIIKVSLPDKAEMIYGGSVNRQNISELANIVGLDGVLVGNASLDPQHFYEICRS